MITNTKKIISNSITNILGKKIKDKIVIIESDDWGTIRMSSKYSYNQLLKKGYAVDTCAYNINDALECNEDLVQLLDVLNSVKGSDGNSAILTVNNIVANPDFEKIKSSGFLKYYFEPFTETLKRYPAHDQVMNLYKNGILAGLIKPQFHGREHLNINRWLKALQNSKKAEIDAFSYNVFSPKIAPNDAYSNEYMDALDFDNKSELINQKSQIEEGLKLFEDIWGYKSYSFIAPCYIWHSELEHILKTNGVKYIQGLVIQREPKEGAGYNYKRIYHYNGQKNKLGQRYFIRNAFFEPTRNPSFDWEGDCLRRLEIAFKLQKPGIISTHRLNFMGWLNIKNRENNLPRFKRLLLSITQKWPDVKFLSTDQLGEKYYQ